MHVRGGFLGFLDQFLHVQLNLCYYNTVICAYPGVSAYLGLIRKVGVRVQLANTALAHFVVMHNVI